MRQLQRILLTLLDVKNITFSENTAQRFLKTLDIYCFGLNAHYLDRTKNRFDYFSLKKETSSYINQKNSKVRR